MLNLIVHDNKLVRKKINIWRRKNIGTVVINCWSFFMYNIFVRFPWYLCISIRHPKTKPSGRVNHFGLPDFFNLLFPKTLLLSMDNINSKIDHNYYIIVRVHPKLITFFIVHPWWKKIKCNKIQFFFIVID